MSFTLGLQCPHDASGECTCKTIEATGLSIFTAAEYGLTESVKRVLERDPTKVHAVDSYGYSPLHFAAQRNHVGVVSLLLSRGTDVNTCKCGATPLHRASASGALATCQLLLDKGADVNLRDSSFGDFKTSLMKAMDGDHQDIVELIYSTGKVDFNVRDAQGRTVRDLGVQNLVMKSNPDGIGEAIGLNELHPIGNQDASEPCTIDVDDFAVQTSVSATFSSYIAVPNVASLLSCSNCGKPSLFMKRGEDGELRCRQCS